MLTCGRDLSIIYQEKKSKHNNIIGVRTNQRPCDMEEEELFVCNHGWSLFLMGTLPPVHDDDVLDIRYTLQASGH